MYIKGFLLLIAIISLCMANLDQTTQEWVDKHCKSWFKRGPDVSHLHFPIEKDGQYMYDTCIIENGSIITISNIKPKGSYKNIHE